jgi:hypothetical protein
MEGPIFTVNVDTLQNNGAKLAINSSRCEYLFWQLAVSGANPTIASYNASVVIFWKQKYFFLLWKRCSLLERWCCSCKFKSRRIGSRMVVTRNYIIFLPLHLLPLQGSDMYFSRLGYVFIKNISLCCLEKHLALLCTAMALYFMYQLTILGLNPEGHF